MSIRKVAVASLLALFLAIGLAASCHARGSFSSGGFSSGRSSYSGGSFSSRSYSAPSRSFSTPSYRAPSTSFSSPKFTPSPAARPSSVSPYRTPATVYRSPSTVVQHHYYGGYGGYGGGMFNNPFFWMWAMDNHSGGYGGYGGTYYAPGSTLPGGQVAGPNGVYAPVVYPLWESVVLWILALSLLFFIFYLIWAFFDWVMDL